MKTITFSQRNILTFDTQRNILLRLALYALLILKKKFSVFNNTCTYLYIYIALNRLDIIEYYLTEKYFWTFCKLLLMRNSVFILNTKPFIGITHFSIMFLDVCSVSNVSKETITYNSFN